jgi:hypothetical protein
VPVPPYGQPSKYEAKVVCTLSNPNLEPRTSGARTPHHLLNGTITPNGLHFVVARGAETDVDPEAHRFVIHGLVKQPMVWTVDALHRYPMVSRITLRTTEFEEKRQTLRQGRNRPVRPSMRRTARNLLSGDKNLDAVVME